MIDTPSEMTLEVAKYNYLGEMYFVYRVGSEDAHAAQTKSDRALSLTCDPTKGQCLISHNDDEIKMMTFHNDDDDDDAVG